MYIYWQVRDINNKGGNEFFLKQWSIFFRYKQMGHKYVIYKS